MAVLGLHCCAWAFSSCIERGLLFVVVHGLLIAVASHCGSFSCCGAWAPGSRASVVVACGLSSCGLRALERRLSSCGARAQLLRSPWDLPRPGLEPVSPALAGGFLATAPPGKSRCPVFLFSKSGNPNQCIIHNKIVNGFSNIMILLNIDQKILASWLCASQYINPLACCAQLSSSQPSILAGMWVSEQCCQCLFTPEGPPLRRTLKTN